MNLTELVMRPFEALAGQPYPDVESLAGDYMEIAGTGSAINWAVGEERHLWRQSLIHLDGVRNFIDNKRQQGDN